MVNVYVYGLRTWEVQQPPTCHALSPTLSAVITSSATICLSCKGIHTHEHKHVACISHTRGLSLIVRHCQTFRRSNAGTTPALRSCILGIGGKALAASLTAATVLEVPLSIVGNLHVASGTTLGFESDTLGFESVLMQQAMHRLVVERHQCCLTATALCADIIEKFDPHVVSDYKRKNIAAAQG